MDLREGSGTASLIGAMQGTASRIERIVFACTKKRKKGYKQVERGLLATPLSARRLRKYKDPHMGVRFEGLPLFLRSCKPE